MKPDDIKFLVDDDIPYAGLMFAGLGDVRIFDRAVGGIPDDGLAGADVLAVTSSTRVDDALLSRCERVRVIATPVVGTDHIDFAAVAAAGERIGHEIHVVNAPGSTAQAVADWTVAAMLAGLQKVPESVAIVGFGNCGRAVAARLDALAVEYVTCDPLLERPGFVHTPLESLDDIQVVTFHVPLTNPGQSPFPTAGMIDASFAARFRDLGGQMIVNCSRGGILDETMFDEVEDSGRRDNGPGPVTTGPAAGLLFALDVFAGEPSPSRRTVAAAAVATPHIAGSGRIGRFNAIRMVRAGVCGIVGLPDSGIPVPDQLAASRPLLEFDAARLRTGDGFKEFSRRLAELSGVNGAGDFRHLWLGRADVDLPSIFRWARAAGLRAEPLWTAPGTT